MKPEVKVYVHDDSVQIDIQCWTLYVPRDIEDDPHVTVQFTDFENVEAVNAELVSD